MKIEKFNGINNVQPQERLTAEDLSDAMNCDITITGQIQRRKGYTRTTPAAYRHLWQADGFLLGVDSLGNLVNVDTSAVLYASLGYTDRVWYCNLPDGRTAFSNGLINGLVTASARTRWGMPIPSGLGSASDVAGSLHPGSYRYSIAYVRDADGREGPPLHSEPIDLASGGISIMGMPTLTGHSINVYLTSHNGTEPYLAGNTTGSAFSFTGANHDLQARLRTNNLSPAPVGTLMAFWKTRALVAVGTTVYASLPHAWELFDMARDFKQIGQLHDTTITLLQPVDGGIFVGTDKALYFMGGQTWDQLAIGRPAVLGPVVLGSGVSAPGKRIGIGDGRASGDCMLCIANGAIVAGLPDGGVAELTRDRYHTEATEVCATFRDVDDIPQYIAIQQ